MTEKNNIRTDEEIIRQLMQSAKIEASENLKHRIIHQIEAEKALTPQRVKPKRETANVLKDFKAIFGVMYLLLCGLSVFTVIFGGTKALSSSQFILTAALIFVVFASFWAITRLDVRLRNTKTKKQ